MYMYLIYRIYYLDMNLFLKFIMYFINLKIILFKFIIYI